MRLPVALGLRPRRCTPFATPAATAGLVPRRHPFILSAIGAVLIAAAGQPARAAQAGAGEALVRDYVAAFNAGEQAMRTFFETHAASNVPVERRMDRYAELKREAGRLALRRIERATAGEVVAVLADASGGTGTFTFVLEGGKLTGIRVEMGGPGEGGDAGPPLPPRDQAAALADVRDIVQKAASADTFSGVVLVTRHDDQRFWTTAVGEADKQAHVANTETTRFNVGSIGKSFTATAVAQLLSAGRLSLDDPVGKFLPQYPNATVREKVTVRHLLEMQSGIGDIFGPNYERMDKSRLLTLADFLPLFADEPLHFQPGERREYSNGGYVVLGLVIEKASGQSYDAYLQSHVFDPAGMRDTGFFPRSAPIANRATGYTTRLGPERRSNFETLPERGSSAGGVYSTAPDLVRYADALAAGRLVAADVLAKVGRDPRSLGIAGGAPGLNAALETDVNGYTLVVLSNYDPPSAERLARDIRRVLQSVK